MARGKKLNNIEKGKILAFKDSGMGYREIARKLNRSLSVIQNFLKNLDNYGIKKSSGRKKKLSARTERKIVKEASNSSKTCTRIKHDLNLNVSKTTIWRTLHRSPYIVHSKLQVAPCLLDHHITDRLKFARQNMYRNWSKVTVLTC